MHYMAKILNVQPHDDFDYENECELEIYGKRFSFRYVSDCEFAEQYLVVNSIIPVDIWMTFYCSIPIISLEKKSYFIANPPDSGCYDVCGIVTKVFSPRSFRLDCGDIVVDVLVDCVKEFPTKVGNYLEIHGDVFAYLEGTSWAWENLFDSEALRPNE